ncbi:MAG: sporulation protein YqfD [Clostridia bacterium]|nr:sporulation protein YqfD [Clostridia bacterium]MDD4387156.1 sporulation protein YqfD [Clostridia bacterium]
MKLSDKAKNITGVLTLEIQGFFTERFINLCKINNIKIWDIRNVVSGVVRFNIHISDFKKLRSIVKKTKCKVTIKAKKGIYFKLFRYRKRKVLGYLIIALILIFMLSTCFIWNINISGNSRISTDIIQEKLKESGIYVGRFKLGMNKIEVLKDIRSTLPDITWVGIEIRGTDIEVKVVEKVVLEDKDKQDNRIGDVISTRDGIITKIIAENGTALLKEGSYVQNGNILIEGKIYSTILGESLIHAKGIVRMNTEYIFEKVYKFTNIVKKYQEKNKHSIGFSLNSKEIFVNYLNKEKKYDKLKASKSFNIFGNNLTFDWYTFSEYTENEVTVTKEDILNEANINSQSYINDIINGLDNGNLIEEKEEIVENLESIIYKKTFTVNERIGKFVERVQ